MKLIVNADDFGLSRGTNYGIFDAHIRGIVTSTTLMVTMQEVDHAIELSKQAPDLRIGLHLNITLGRPLTAQVLLKMAVCFTSLQNYLIKRNLKKMKYLRIIVLKNR